MNKRDLIDAISGRLGDKKSATEALNAVLETIQSAVASGDKVAITGFGVFEKSERPARTARNPATGATIQVPRPRCPSSAPGADFKALVNGEKPKTSPRSQRREQATAASGEKSAADVALDAASRPSHWRGRSARADVRRQARARGAAPAAAGSG